MRAVKSKNTETEMTVRRFLHRSGLRYRLHDRRLPGTPDLIFPARRVALFIHGCFWHQHPGCKRARLPKENSEYWTPKLQKNSDRDWRSMQALRSMGWQVLVIWECETHDTGRLNEIAQQIRG